MRIQFAAVLALSLLGCEPPPKAQPAAGPPPSPPAAPGALPPGTIEAKDATGVWNQAQVEQFIQEDMHFQKLTLKSTGKHDYEGTATDAEGIAYTIQVKQAPGGIRVDWKHATGEGKITFGNPVP